MPKLSFHPLTSHRWPDLERLFGPRGACAGCWCMWWLLTRPEWNRGKGEGNRKAFWEVVRSGAEPGVLAYADGEPVGWSPSHRVSDTPNSTTAAFSSQWTISQCGR